MGGRRVIDVHEEQTLERVYVECFERLCYHAFCLINDEEAAKDIVNDVFVFVYEDWAKYASRSMLPFLLTLVHNACIDYIRHTNSRRRYEEYALSMETEVDNGLFTDYEERVERVMKEVNMMPPQMRRIFIECYVNNKMYKEVGEELGISVNTVKTNIYRGLKILRKKMSKDTFLALFYIFYLFL